jgi:non-canonical purine NTP pyrophosphatase (RdgB/HAM1 family)
MGEARKVVLASRNADKVRELKHLCAGMPFAILSAADYPGLPEIVEDGTTILGNATRKAIVTAAFTGEIALADDTSLQVRELNGWPDIFAARFSGPDATYRSNAELVLELMRDVPDGYRQARFATACCWVDPRPELVTYTVARPATRRWLRNPWERAIEIQHKGEEAAYWNGFGDRVKQWQQYATMMTADLAGHGHDHQRLAEIAAGLLATCPDYSGDEFAVEPGAMRLPDSRVWAVQGPDDHEPPMTRVAPSGLPSEASGRAVNDSFWLEISTDGKLLGDITRQPIGGEGFGYDPIFRPGGGPRTLAEYEPDEKSRISHRGRALRRLIHAVQGSYGIKPAKVRPAAV